MELPLVSIIIPCYNAEEFVRQAVKSALHQTYERVEVIVIDDGSTDDSRKVFTSFGERITWRATENEGACAARKLGVRLASRTFVKFLDAADVLSSRAIEEQVGQSLRFDARERAIVYGHHGKMKEDGTGKREQGVLVCEVGADAPLGHVLVHPTLHDKSYDPRLLLIFGPLF